MSAMVGVWNFQKFFSSCANDLNQQLKLSHGTCTCHKSFSARQFVQVTNELWIVKKQSRFDVEEI
jgi:hypothetical protein